MNGMKHELVGSASAAAAAAAYQNPLLYAPTPSWMGSENFPGKTKTKKRSIEMIDQQLDFFLRFIKFFLSFVRILLDLTGGCQSFKIENIKLSI